MQNITPFLWAPDGKIDIARLQQAAYEDRKRGSSSMIIIEYHALQETGAL